MFRGRFMHTMDPKGRVSIPVSFRSLLRDDEGRAPILTNLQHCVALYAHAAWLEVEDELTRGPAMKPEVQAVQRFMVSGATECPIDGAGRILVPPYLRKHAALEKDIVIAGVGKRVELWNSDRFTRDLERTTDNLSAWAQDLRL